ncbi:MAG: hypothetical protein IT265_12390 [Saprospiraceae bacterium]|nr:hypothetical protein [Saprospiraceae bacterium]
MRFNTINLTIQIVDNQIKVISIVIGILAFIWFLPDSIIAQKIKYFDEENIEISKKQYNHKLNSKNYLEIPGDSIYCIKLIARAQSGQIENIELLYHTLEVELKQKLDYTKPLIIIYYPGKDACNSNGSQNVDYFEKWYEELESGVFQITQTKPIYNYKKADGIEKYGKHLVWYKDPLNIIEKTFFKYSYPCNSFVVISQQGQLESYFGEFPKEYVWKACQLLKN